MVAIQAKLSIVNKNSCVSWNGMKYGIKSMPNIYCKHLEGNEKSAQREWAAEVIPQMNTCNKMSKQSDMLGTCEENVESGKLWAKRIDPR